MNIIYILLICVIQVSGHLTSLAAQSTTAAHYIPTHASGIIAPPTASASYTSATSALETLWSAAFTHHQLRSAVYIAAADAPTATTTWATGYKVFESRTDSSVFRVTSTLDNAQMSIAVWGYDWEKIVNEEWYVEGVDEVWRKGVREQGVRLQSAFDRIVGVRSAVGNNGAWRGEGAGIWVGAVVAGWFLVWVGVFL